MKRKLEYDNSHQQSYIDPKRIYKALGFLKSKGHPKYQFYDDYNVYVKRYQVLKLHPIDDQYIERIIELDEHIKNLEKEKEKSSEEFSDEDEEYIRKFQFDYDTSVCLVDKYPEAALKEPASNGGKDISFAPGEGKIPENILTTKNWDRDAFPMKHPDGKHNLHQSRDRKLTDQYYFVQRLRNKDTRFSSDPAYIFAAAAYLEKKQLQSNIKISYQRGKESKSADGVSTFNL